MRSCQLSNSFQQGSTNAIAIHAWHRICEGGCASSSYRTISNLAPILVSPPLTHRGVYHYGCCCALATTNELLCCVCTYMQMFYMLSLLLYRTTNCCYCTTNTTLNCCCCRCCSDADWLLATQASCMISATRTRLCSLSRHHSRRLHSGVHVLLSAYGTCTHHTCTRWKAAGRPLVHGHVDKLVYTVLHSPLLHPVDV
jgi:hypothetical protein